MDNDGIHKFAYGHEALFADLLHLAVPALAAELDLARAELLPTALVSAGAARSERSARGYPSMKQRHGAGRRRPCYPFLDKMHSTAKLEEIGEWLVAEPLDELIAKIEAAVADDRIH